MLTLQICTGDLFSTYGGGQVYVRNIVDEFIRQGVSIAVVSFVGSDDAGVVKRDYRGCDLYEIGAVDMTQLHGLIREINPDVIHAHSHKADISLIGKSLNIPTIITAHHGGILCPAGALLNTRDEICTVRHSAKNCLKCTINNVRFGRVFYPIMRMLPHGFSLKLGDLAKKAPFIPVASPVAMSPLSVDSKIREWDIIAQNATKIIAPSLAIRDAMVRCGADDTKIDIVPHGIPLPPDKLVKKSHSNRTKKFFFVGRICYVKGVHILLEALSKVDNPDIELHIIGGAGNRGEERYRNCLQKKYRHDKRIIWEGKVKPDQLFEHICHYDVMIHSAIFLEVFGMTISESISLGIPVIATRCGGAEMQIEEGVNGWLVKPNSVVSLQTKIEDISTKISITQTDKNSIISITKHCQTLYSIYEKNID